MLRGRSLDRENAGVLASSSTRPGDRAPVAGPTPEEFVMPRRPSPLSLAVGVSTGLALFLLAAAPAPAEDQRKGILPGGDGEAKFLKEHAASKAVFNSINRPMEGEKASKENAEHKNA